jgi:hypothetical protein
MTGLRGEEPSSRAPAVGKGVIGSPASSSPPSPRLIAALFVAKGGIYYGIEGVDPWDLERDARLYDGPHPVVAHPPCARWSSLAYVNQARHGYKVGDDDGCFEAALHAVRTFGGVLEHPGGSLAWIEFGLPRPIRGGWTQAFGDPGFTTEVSQVVYGHRARKRTWLYAVGCDLPTLDWGDAEGECIVGDLWHGEGRRKGRGDRPRMYQREALSTPEAFRDVLIQMARSARVTSEVALPDRLDDTTEERERRMAEAGTLWDW